MAGTARGWWERVDARPRLRDVIVAGVYLVLGIVLFWVGAIRLSAAIAPLRVEDPFFLLTLLGVCAIALLRSGLPLLALALGSVVTAVDGLGGSSLAVILVFFDLVYCAVKYGSDRGIRVATWIAVALAAAAGVTLLIVRPESPGALIVMAQWALITTIAAAWGWNVRSERLRTRALMAEQHARATQQMRQRIAHDLHDLVSNQIAVAGLHVEAARLRVEQAGIVAPEISRSFDQAKQGADQAHRQLRRLIAVLSTVDDLGEASPDIAAELSRLEAMPPGGRSLIWSGDGRGGIRDALDHQPPDRAGVLLRVLQELVANAVKHGRGDIEVSVVVRDAGTAARGSGTEVRHSGTAVTVRNTYLGAGAPERGSGIGITGAALLLDGTGATLESGPEPVGERGGGAGAGAGTGAGAGAGAQTAGARADEGRNVTDRNATGRNTTSRQWRAVLSIE